MKRFFVSVLLAAWLTCAGAEAAAEGPVLLAWWGTIYPDFCFVNGEMAGAKEGRESKREIQGQRAQGRKIGFCIAKLFDWC